MGQWLGEDERDIPGLAEDPERDISCGKMCLSQCGPLNDLARNASTHGQVLEVLIRPPVLVAIGVRQERED